MAKDKKKKQDQKGIEASKKGNKVAKKGTVASVAKTPKKAARSLQTPTENPLVADVVAAALVAMASALKDSNKARRLASDAGDQLKALSNAGAKQGNAMWDLALDVGRRAIETLGGEEGGKAKAPKRVKKAAR